MIAVDSVFSTVHIGGFTVREIMIPNKFMIDPKWSATKWIATKSGDVTVLLTIGTEEKLSWLKSVYGTGKTREDALTNLKKNLNGDGNW